MFWNWFKSKVDSPTLDKFRIKVIILKDGTKKYFAQYKENSLSSEWLVILRLANGNLFYDMSHNELMNTKHYLESEDIARELIEETKKELLIIRAKEFLSEEIIKVN